MQNIFKKNLNNQRGATMIEYALLVAFIAMVALVGVKALGVDINTLFTNISASL